MKKISLVLMMLLVITTTFVGCGEKEENLEVEVKNDVSNERETLAELKNRPILRSTLAMLMPISDENINCGNILGSKSEKSEYTRDKVKTITILDTKKDKIPSNYIDCWDVSEYANGSVMLWLTVSKQDKNMYDVYIGGENGVISVEPAYLFALYINCTNIYGLDKLDISYAENLNYMFAYCLNLKEIDVSSFDTSNVKNMKNMFYNCRQLEEIDVSKFDTSNVTNFENVFVGCDKLPNKDSLLTFNN